jgi:hypothetical protein
MSLSLFKKLVQAGAFVDAHLCVVEVQSHQSEFVGRYSSTGSGRGSEFRRLLNKTKRACYFFAKQKDKGFAGLSLVLLAFY